MKTNLKLLAVLLSILTTLNANAAEFVSTSDVVKQIEKSLLFNKSSREQIDFYQKKSAKNNQSSDNLPSTKIDESQFSVIVADSKKNNLNLREKEQLAYNSSLVGQYEVSVELYGQVIKAEPKNQYAKFALATVYQKIKQNRQAKEIYYELLKDGSDRQDEIIANLLDILIEDAPNDATYLLSRLAAQNPDSPSLMAYSAMAFEKSKKYDQAILMLEKAVTLDPFNVEYKYNLAVIYDKTENFQKASELYSQVVKDHDGNANISLIDVSKRLEYINKKI